MGLRVQKETAQKWKPLERYRVPDLSPKDRPQLAKVPIRWVFVAESPHLQEIEPELIHQRRPLCGAAGKQWWGLLSELIEGESSTDLSLEHFIQFCKKHQIAVLNAVQFPLDPKIARLYPKADPVLNLGFNKVSGPASFKRLKASAPVQMAVESLRERLLHPSLSRASIHCLGNDAEWLVGQALESSGALARLGVKIPHPSAWWRRGGEFGRIARTRLVEIFEEKRGRSPTS